MKNSVNHISWLWFALAAALILAGCKDNTEEPENPPPADLCETNPTPDCDNYCEVYPNERGCPNYCIINPNEPECPTDPPDPLVCASNAVGSDFTETTGGLNMKMVFVKCGRMKLGCNITDCGEPTESPAFLVELSSYYIGKLEVTQRQWKSIMGTDTTPSFFVGDSLPVEMVSWDDANEFIDSLNAKTGKKYRLPTNAEWEYAARGGTESRGYAYSGSDNIGDVAWYTDNSGGSVDGSTQTVGTKAPNELGLHDMSGNVYEWVSDWYGNYNNEDPLGEPIVNPKGPETGTKRVNRGGNWAQSAIQCRVSARSSLQPEESRKMIGFRIALPAE